MNKGITHLTWRAVILAILGSILITASSTYVALRASALPWPTIFVAVLSFAIMRLFGQRDVNEINVAATGMSAGAMVAGGLVFTLPGLFISGIWEAGSSSSTSAGDFIRSRFPIVLLLALAGVLLGTTLCWLFRKRNIEQIELPYPIGKAAASTLKAGASGGKGALILFGSLAVAVVITLLRDQFLLFPSLAVFAIAGIPLTFSISPMAIGIGSLIGFSSTAYWLLGAAITTLGRFVLLRAATTRGWSGMEETLANWNLTIAVALMVGAGTGTLIHFVLGSYKKRTKKSKRSRDTNQASRFVAPKGIGFFMLILVAVAFVFTILAGLNVIPALLVMVGVFFAAMMSSIITGQTGINPMEIFGIIVLLAIRAVLHVSAEHAFYIAAIVAVACGYAGDMMNDYKSGAILKTNPSAQFFIELIGGFFGALTASIALLAIIYSSGGVGAAAGLPAAQAHSVTAMVSGLGDPVVFAIAAVVGCLLTLLKIPAMVIGIGMMLTGYGMALPIFLGGLIQWVSEKRLAESGRQSIQMGAAGLLGGEGIMGTVLAIIGLFK